ncbi:MAG: hypothetical protein JEZ14_14960 [Marinilabiliaceae bacterium]|nr:hypothetical protein [Marinilabiliaceae bacterium]
MATTKATKKALTTKEELALMKKVKSDVLYRNHKGEYFTSENLAGLSITAEEKKKGEKVTKLERQVLEGKTPEATE